MPWWEARILPGPAWPQAEPLFRQALGLLNDERIDELEELLRRIQDSGFRLLDADDRELRDFALYVEDDRARLRYLD
jgi:hypothetical protein